MSISGKFITCTIGNVEVEGNYAWEVEEGGDVLDRTVGSDNGAARQDMGVQDCRISIRGYMDVSTGNYIPVRRGTVISNLELFRNDTDTNAAFVIPEALVSRSKQKAEVRGKVEWDCDALANGEYTCNDP